jgi:hypothetical protein
MARPILNLTLLTGMIAGALLWASHSLLAPAKNGFRRRLLPGRLTIAARLPNTGGIIAPAEVAGSGLVFFTERPGWLLRTGPLLERPRSLRLPVPPARKLSSRFTVQTDSAAAYLFAGNVPAIYRFGLRSPGAFQTYPLPAVFTAGLWCRGRFLLRILQKRGKGFDAVFAAYDPATRGVRYEQGLSARRGDLGFSSDGMLRYDAGAGLAVFVEFYTNRVTVFDPELRLRYRAHTIDTVSRNRAEYHRLGTAFTNTSPRRLINSQCCTDNGTLFVQSELQADNEDLAGRAVIDRYDLRTGGYRGSFYVPASHGDRPWRFRVRGNRLIAVYPREIVVYRLP